MSRQKYVRIYRGVQTKIKVKGVSLTLEPGDPDGVECGVCGAFVKRLLRGQPRAHAAGGIATSATRGLYSCEGSGTLAK